MSDVTPIFKKYSLKYEHKIKKICAPLVVHLQTPVFTYCFVNEDGHFGYISNALEFNEYYFEEKIYLQNPYFSHPDYFRSGSAFVPCVANDDIQKTLIKKFNADHLFFTLEKNEKGMEFFIFAHENVSAKGSSCYFPRLDLYQKFSRYFKREARELIGKMKADQFNIQKERGKLFENVPQVPLVLDEPNIQAFLKGILALSPQERKCLELFKLGHTAQSTAAVMGLSRRTIESYFDNIKKKLGCYSKHELLKY